MQLTFWVSLLAIVAHECRADNAIVPRSTLSTVRIRTTNAPVNPTIRTTTTTTSPRTTTSSTSVSTSTTTSSTIRTTTSTTLTSTSRSSTTSSTTSRTTTSTTSSTTSSTTIRTSTSSSPTVISSTTSTTTTSPSSSTTSTSTFSLSSSSSSTIIIPSGDPTTSITTTTTRSTTTSVSTTASTTTTTQAPVVTDEAYIDTILRHHNVHRANHTVPNVVWSPSLAQTARSISETCNYNHNTSADGGGYGQNIGAGFPSTNMGQFVTDGLYNSEVNAYTYYGGEPDTSTVGAWGHFSQIVWKATTAVGCYTKDCSATGLTNAPGVPPFFTVCNYSPAGNVVGAFAANVLRPVGNPTVFANYECPTAANCVGPTQ